MISAETYKILRARAKTFIHKLGYENRPTPMPHNLTKDLTDEEEDLFLNLLKSQGAMRVGVNMWELRKGRKSNVS